MNYSKKDLILLAMQGKYKSLVAGELNDELMDALLASYVLFLLEPSNSPLPQYTDTATQIDIVSIDAASLILGTDPSASTLGNVGGIYHKVIKVYNSEQTDFSSVYVFNRSGSIMSLYIPTANLMLAANRYKLNNMTTAAIETIVSSALAAVPDVNVPSIQGREIKESPKRLI